MDSADSRLSGLKASDVSGAVTGKLTADRALWLIVVLALLVLMALRGVFRGALGD